MSAITVHPILEPIGAPTQGPRLVLVPSGPDLRRLGRTPRVPLGVTRRGRLVLALLALLLLGVVGAGVGVALADTPGPVRTVTVQAGQTLSEIAVVALPDLALSDAIIELQLANALSTDQVHTGQTLTIPAR